MKRVAETCPEDDEHGTWRALHNFFEIINDVLIVVTPFFRLFLIAALTFSDGAHIIGAHRPR
jgi:hypothetical protein